MRNTWPNSMIAATSRKNSGATTANSTAAVPGRQQRLFVERRIKSAVILIDSRRHRDRRVAQPDVLRDQVAGTVVFAEQMTIVVVDVLPVVVAGTGCARACAALQRHADALADGVVCIAREQGDAIVATAQELPDRTAAEAVKGARVFVSRGSFPTPDEDEYYWVDLIGLDVFDRSARLLGRVDHLIETGPHCVLAVQGPDAATAQRLIPFVAAYVDRVDIAGRRIEVDWADDHAT